MQCLTAWGQWAVELLQMHCRTARGQWAVELQEPRLPIKPRHMHLNALWMPWLGYHSESWVLVQHALQHLLLPVIKDPRRKLLHH